MSIPGVQYVLHAGCMQGIDVLHAGRRRPATRRRRRELYTVIQWRCSHLDGNAGCMQPAYGRMQAAYDRLHASVVGTRL